MVGLGLHKVGGQEKSAIHPGLSLLDMVDRTAPALDWYRNRTEEEDMGWAGSCGPWQLPS